MTGFRASVKFAPALLLLAGCAKEVPLHYVGQPVLLPDGHSSEVLLAGGTPADPQHWTQDMVTAGVHTYYRGGVLVSDVHDMRPVTAPGAGYALAQMAIPAAIQGGATFGAGIVVSHGIMQAGAWQGEGAAAAGKAVGQGIANGDKALGQGYAAAKPPIATSTTVNNNMFANTNSQNAVSSLSNTNTLRNTNNLTANSSSHSSSNATSVSGAFQFQKQ